MIKNAANAISMSTAIIVNAVAHAAGDIPPRKSRTQPTAKGPMNPRPASTPLPVPLGLLQQYRHNSDLGICPT